MAKGTEQWSVEDFRRARDAGNVNKKGRITGVALPAPKGKIQAAGDQSPQVPKKHKYNAVEDGNEDSKLQKKHASEYRLMLKAGEIAMYARQVEISLVSPRTGGRHVFICDHCITHWDGRVELIDTKGFETTEFKKKANWMERQFLPRCPWVSFKARFAKHEHVYQARPLNGKK